MSWHSHDDQNHKQLYWDTVSGDAFRLWYGLVGECLALRKWDGILPRYVAMCATPGLLPRFEELVAELVTINGLIDDRGAEIELLQIEQHIPPEGQRPEVMGPRKAKNQAEYRRRKCERGDHSKDCPPATCPAKANSRQKPSVAKRVADNAGTGSGTGREGQALEVKGSVPEQRQASEPDSTAPPPCGVDLTTGELSEPGLYKPCLCGDTTGTCTTCFDEPEPSPSTSGAYHPSMEPPGWR